MPTYDYACEKCGFKEEQIHSMKEQPVFFCPECKKNGLEIKMFRVFSLNGSGFIIRGGTEASHWKEKRVRLEKNKELSVKQIERYGSGPRLKPNVGGLEQESWGDAAKLAKEAGLNTASYEPFIEKEKRTSKSSNVDDIKWKEVKNQI